MKEILITLLMISNIAFAGFEGNGSTGGGHVYGDKLNPWFLQNTKTVHYCVEVAPGFSDLSLSRINELVGSAFSYWKNSFSKYENNFHLSFPFPAAVATQDFILDETCRPETEILFQMGFLTPDQIKSHPNYRHTIGLTERTSYDEVHLRGKGYIYIAAEKGSFRPVSNNFHSAPWSYGGNDSLRLVLIHELGHVFGLQDNYYSEDQVMGAKFPEMVTRVEWVRVMPKFLIPSIFGCNKDYEVDINMAHGSVPVPGTIEIENKNIPESNIGDILGLPSNYTLDIKTKNRIINFQINKDHFARIALNGSDSESNRWHSIITTYLTEKQEVFKNLPKDAYHDHIPTYQVHENLRRKSEVLELADGRKFDVFLSFNSSCVPSVGMIHEGNVIFDIFLNY